MHAIVQQAIDFDLSGDGASPAWHSAAWIPLTCIKGKSTVATRLKLLYSTTGFYCLFDCEDHLLMCSDLNAYDDLWKEDVVEGFFWPDESQHLYLEYELSPLGAELLLLVPNHEGRFQGWSPWHYQGDRRARRATSIRGGTKSPGAIITGWTAEFFIPFSLMVGLRNVPPLPGTRWRANFYRIDHEHEDQSWFAWAPRVRDGFHDLPHFGTVTFA